MSTRSSFYVTLPSNGSGQYYKDNTISCFRNHLAQALELEGQWEVALVEMQFPITWRLLTQNNKIGLLFYHKTTVGQYKPTWSMSKISLKSQTFHNFVKKENIKRAGKFTREDLLGIDPYSNYSAMNLPEVETNVGYVLIDLNDGYALRIWVLEGSIYKSFDYVEAFLPHQYYYSPQHVAREAVTALRAQLARATTLYKDLPASNGDGSPSMLLNWNLDPESATISFNTRVDSADAFLVMYKSSEELHRVLGFQTLTQDVARYKIPMTSASTRPQMKFSTPALYVYSDIIGDELVGDVKVPLLRAVPIEGMMGDFVHKEFIRPYYKPLNKGYINSILIEVKDDTGKDMQFTLGKVICTLHFRRCGLAV